MTSQDSEVKCSVSRSTEARARASPILTRHLLDAHELADAWVLVVAIDEYRVPDDMAHARSLHTPTYGRLATTSPRGTTPGETVVSAANANGSRRMIFFSMLDSPLYEGKIGE